MSMQYYVKEYNLLRWFQPPELFKYFYEVFFKKKFEPMQLPFNGRQRMFEVVLKGVIIERIHESFW
jgi:hypothetical protein